ncbi:hypothetical protein [Amycolatopsis albispora]|uniref:Uncharacterized protein n=1 Tax=Amycolatopsis albispora TaxID=1804986 RepID=A0A344LAM9_9PSEU|nr:hypothetical protein [Amycolatopsis albispora]AXB45103.1 hypothetical protein A4R43_23545 [Amycolatopsis albispora]
MSDATELGRFLKAHRAELAPSDFGVPPGVNLRNIATPRRRSPAQRTGGFEAMAPKEHSLPRLFFNEAAAGLSERRRNLRVSRVAEAARAR